MKIENMYRFLFTVETKKKVPVFVWNLGAYSCNVKGCWSHHHPFSLSLQQPENLFIYAGKLSLFLNCMKCSDMVLNRSKARYFVRSRWKEQSVRCCTELEHCFQVPAIVVIIFCETVHKSSITASCCKRWRNTVFKTL